LCDRAAEHGLLVAIEFMPWTGIPDAATAGAIARDAGRRNGGINADTWHHFRGAADDAALREHAARIFMIQLDDADAPVGEPFEDTILRRRYPGEGSFDVAGFVALLDDAGVDVPLSVEVLNPDHWALPVAEAARRAYDATRQVVDAARAGPG
jgi:sugar phosphate isomerase/epimerase